MATLDIILNTVREAFPELEEQIKKIHRSAPRYALHIPLGSEQATLAQPAHLSPQAMLGAVNVVGNLVGRRPVVAANHTQLVAAQA